MRSRIGWSILGLAVALIVIALMRFNLSALHEPGRFEVLVSYKARHLLVHRASSICHGTDGHAQMPVGRWMYPRAADLTTGQVQSYSDQELFWIIENGIRFTGMPAFGQVEAADHIWNLVDHVRTLPGNAQNESSSK